VPPEQRIATFDQDGTTWVERPIYSQVLFTFDRVAALAPQHPEWKTMHSGLRRGHARDAGASRRPGARLCIRSGAGSAR
jgi:hypothetical protein